MKNGVAQYISIGKNSYLRFIGDNNIWVEDSAVNQDSLVFMQYLIAEALNNTIPGQLEVFIFDDELTGLAAPFQGVNNGGEKILHTINDRHELDDILKYLHDHISSVLNTMQGRISSLLEFRKRVPHAADGFKMIVLSCDISLLDEKTLNNLLTLIKAGPRAGVTFLVHSMTSSVNNFFLRIFQRIEIERNGVYDEDGNLIGSFVPREVDEILNISSQTAELIKNSQVTSVAFGEVENLQETWTYSSAEGISFSVGVHGLSPIEITLGDELNQRHNALITGAVGQGKSNLISVIVHSLCHRYSPQEIKLFLLDFKEGVTLQAFAPDEHGVFLPHARVLGLDADREYGLNVLKYLFTVYKERMTTFKKAGVQNIRQFRLANPETPMPRLVVIIDEFQLLFAEDDEIGAVATDLLAKGARLFRASGIHFILASQTIASGYKLNSSVGEGLFSQVPIRIALKNSLAESHATLGFKNDAASHLRSREAIVNLDYGELSANRKTAIAYADESILADLRKEWWRRTEGKKLPEVFEGERRLSLSEEMNYLKKLYSGQTIIGRQIGVNMSPLSVEFSRNIGRNLVLLGTGPGHSILINLAVGLAHTTPNAEFVLLDMIGDWLSPERERQRRFFESYMADLGANHRLVGKHEAYEFMSNLNDQVNSKNNRSDPIYIFGFGMDRLSYADAKMLNIEEFFQNAPMFGIHFLGWWSKHNLFTKHGGFEGLNNFDIRLAMHLDLSSARDAFDNPILSWSPHDNRVLVLDSATMSSTQVVIPYTVAY